MSLSALEKRKANNRRQGLCVNCSERAVEGRLRCERHLEYLRTRMRTLRRERRAEGVCTQCSNRLPFRWGMCARCLIPNRRRAVAFKAEQYKRDVAAGLCPRCRIERPGPFVWCAWCTVRGRIDADHPAYKREVRRIQRQRARGLYLRRPR